MDRNQLCADMMEVARGCGKIILEASRMDEEDSITARTKSSFRDLVTQYDVQVQEYAINQLRQMYPEANFISEESDAAITDPSSITFVIDPIDGTANFVHHGQHSCTSIGCVQDGQTIAAAIYDPYLDEMFHAVRGEGAYLNQRRLQIPEHNLSESLVLFGSAPYNPEFTDETFRNLRSLFGRCQDVRRSGSAALDLCSVAAGRAGIFFESILSVWDYAAGSLIVEEAGGQCLSYDAQPVVVNRPVKSSVIAGRREILEESGLLNNRR